MKKIAILGLGPSGMFSVMACNDKGYKPVVISTGSLRSPAGAFYFHWIPPQYARKVPQEVITYSYIGTNQIYLQKQWGDSIQGQVSSSFGKYDMELGYSPWRTVQVFQDTAAFDYVAREPLSTEEVFELCKVNDLVVCTFPLGALMADLFTVPRPVTIQQGSPTAQNLIVYNGTWEEKWVRRSHLFGRIYTEYCHLEDVAGSPYQVITIRDIHPQLAPANLEGIPDNLHFSGRNAELNRKRLAHEAYYTMEDLIDAI